MVVVVTVIITENQNQLFAFMANKPRDHTCYNLWMFFS